MTDNLWEITKAMEVLRQDNWTAEVTSELRNFEKSLIVALKEKGWDGKESLDTVTWSFTGGLFYSITGMCGLNQGPPPIFGTTKTSAFSINAQSRIVSIALDGVLPPPHLVWHN